MSRARDIIEEIAQIRQRRRFHEAMAELLMRLFSLEHAFKSYETLDDELKRYFPVAMIACIEGYCRLAIKNLVDAGEPYLTNAERLFSSTKLEFAILRAVHGRTISVGEIVSHGVPLSRIEHIDSSFSSLLGRSFLRELRSTYDRWAHEVKGQPKEPILRDADAVFADVQRTFELRHIICHELATAYEIQAEEIARCFESCLLFVRAADELVSNTLHPNAPLTQKEMSIAAGQSLEDARSKMATAEASLKGRLSPADFEAFEKSQAKWGEYCEAWAEFCAGPIVGAGTIRPLLYLGVAEAATQRRMEELLAYRQLWEKP